jgi:ribosomal protein L9
MQVSSGYYNNFLRPKSLAVLISDEQVAERNEKLAEELARIKEQVTTSV